MGATSNKPKKGAAKVRHLGRKKAKIVAYYERSYPRNKLRRILKSNGPEAARAWAMKHGAFDLARKLGIEV